MNNSTYPTLILGGGFTGLFTALHLSHQQYSRPLLLIDQQERFTFKPMLYELLSGEMSDHQVWPRYEELLYGSGVTFVQDTVEAIDLEQRQVKLVSDLRYTYSHLVLALGCVTSCFGVAGAQENCLSFRTGEHAVALLKQLRNCLQRASQMIDPQQRRALLTVAIVGAGPAGIELATTLADLLPNWYVQLGGDPDEIRVVLMTRGTKILRGHVKNDLRETAQAALQARNVPVEMLLRAKVTAVHPDRVEFDHYGEASTLQAATIVWTAGTTVPPLIKALPIPEDQRDRNGRLQVTPTLQLPGFPEVFAGGDCAVSTQDPLPPLAQVAYQQGAAIAYNLKAISEGNSPSPADVNLRRAMLKLGLEESAASLFDRFEVTGKLGHMIRQATYLELLPNPVHSFKATAEWLVDEIFQRYTSPVSS